MNRSAVVSLLISCFAFGAIAHAELPPFDPTSLRGLCVDGEDVRFSCSSEGEGGMFSVCYKDERLAFRFGKPGRVEVALPQESGKGSVKGWSTKYPSSSSDSFSVEAELSFQGSDRSYVLAHTLYDDKESGFDQLIVKKGDSVIANHRCDTGKVVTGYVGDIVAEAKTLGYSVTQE